MTELIVFPFKCLFKYSKISFTPGLRLVNPRIRWITAKGSFPGENHPCGHHPSFLMKSPVPRTLIQVRYGTASFSRLCDVIWN